MPQANHLQERINNVIEKYNNPKYGIITEKLIKQQDTILLKYNYSYLIQEKLRIFYLKSQLFSEENFTIPNVLSNESFRFLEEDKNYLKNNNDDELNIPSNSVAEVDEDENENEDEDEDDTVASILNNMN